MKVDEIQIGYKVQIRKDMQENDMQKGEVLGIRTIDITKEFYIHYVDFNKRLDEWVSSSLLDLNEPVEIPKKKKKDEKITETKNQIVNDDDTYRIKNVKKIQISDFLIDAWYFSPYPESVALSEVVYICEFCLFYFESKESLLEHANSCELRHPPGIEIYRANGLSFFELDGHMHKNYCRNLSLLSKLFLDHKTLYYDIDVFMFYVLCRATPAGLLIVGYFSKEKMSEHGYNLACILTLPHEQRKGYGKTLIDFSYLLSKKDGLVASPEKPLSDLGLLGYRSYWTETVVDCLRNSKKASIKEISLQTAILEEDIIGALSANGIIQFYNGTPVFVLTEKVIEKSIKSMSYRVEPAALKK